MMKNFKKIISLIVSSSMLAASLVMPVAAADTQLFYDDMEAHELTDAISGTSGTANTIVDGYWETSANFGGDTNNSYQLRYDLKYGNVYNGGEGPTTNKTIALTPTGNTGGLPAAVNLVYDVGSAENYTYSVDVRNSYGSSQTPVSGIRMYNPENEADYYELSLITPQDPGNYVYSEYDGAKIGSLPPRFTKVEGAKETTPATYADTAIPDEWKATAYSPESAVTMLHKVQNLNDPSDYELRTTWFTLTLTKVGNTICWSVYDKERQATVWEASYEDDTPLFDGMGKLQLFVYGNGANNTVFFDNVEITSVDASTFVVPEAAVLTEKAEPEPEPEPDEEKYTPTVSTPDTPLYLFRDTIEGYQVYTPVGTKAEDITNNVPSYATGYGGNVADVMVDGYWATSPILGGTDWYSDYCVQYDELTGNGWDGKVTAPIRYLYSTPDESNKVIALQPAYNEAGQLCVLNLTKNLGDADEFIYSVDVRNFFSGNVNPVAGIRVADPTDDTSYYELALISNGESFDVDHQGAKFEKPRFTKVEGGNTHTTAQAASGSEPAEWKYVDYGNVGTASGMYKNDGYKTSWFTLTIAKKGDTIYWSILDKAFGEVVWEDSFTDSNPLFDGLGRLQLFAYGAGKMQLPTFFDNIDAKKLGTKLFKYEDIAGTFSEGMSDTAVEAVPSGFSSTVSYTVNYDKLYANFWGGESDTDVTTSKVLWLDGSGKLDYTANTGNTYKVDLRNYFYGETNPVMGIRILDPNDDANYYELAILSGTGVFESTNDVKLHPPRFTKVQGAKSTTPAISTTAPDEVLYSESGTEKTASALYRDIDAGRSYSTNWYTLELGKEENNISIKVLDKESGGVIWSKTWTDETPLFEGAGKLQIFTYGGYGKLLIDNVECTAMGDSGLRIEASWVKESKGSPMMMTADYDAEGRLLSVEDIVAPSGNKGYYFSPKSIELAGSLKKLFIWDEKTCEPVVATAQYQEGDINECNVTYPNFSTKAFTVSLDDGNSSYDPAVMAIMKKYGIKGTFNLTGSQWTNYEDYLYDDFEVANHTTHIEMYQDQYSYDDCVKSIDDGHALVKEYTGGIECEGVIWPYRAPKNRVFWSELYEYVSSKYEYARETGESYDFSAPLDWMQWTATAWSDNWRTYTDKFMALEATDELQMLALAGHAFDEPAGETSMTALCEYVFSSVASDNTIWKATNIELCKYIKAAKTLEITSKNVYNPSEDVTVYMIIDGQQYIAEPQSYARPIN